MSRLAIDGRSTIAAVNKSWPMAGTGMRGRVTGTATATAVVGSGLYSYKTTFVGMMLAVMLLMWCPCRVPEAHARRASKHRFKIEVAGRTVVMPLQDDFRVVDAARFASRRLQEEIRGFMMSGVALDEDVKMSDLREMAADVPLVALLQEGGQEKRLGNNRERSEWEMMSSNHGGGNQRRIDRKGEDEDEDEDAMQLTCTKEEAEQYFDQADRLRSEGKLKEALRYYTLASTGDFDELAVMYAKGTLHLDLGQFAEAAKLLKRAIRKIKGAHNKVGAYMGLWSAETELGNVRDAEKSMMFVLGQWKKQLADDPTGLNFDEDGYVSSELMEALWSVRKVKAAAEVGERAMEISNAMLRDCRQKPCKGLEGTVYLTYAQAIDALGRHRESTKMFWQTHSSIMRSWEGMGLPREEIHSRRDKSLMLYHGCWTRFARLCQKAGKPPTVGTNALDEEWETRGADRGGYDDSNNAQSEQDPLVSHILTDPAFATRHVERRHIRDLSQKQFIEQYVNPGKPVILRGLLEGWPAKTRWRRKKFIALYGNKTITVRKSSLIVPVQVYGKNDTETWNDLERQTISDYLSFNDESNSGKHDRYYFFGSIKSDDSTRLNVDKDYYMLPYFKDPRFAWPETKRRDDSLFFVGSSGSGTYMHVHSNAYNAMLYGKKHWFLSPPRTYYGPRQMRLKEWVDTVLPHLPLPPLQVMFHTLLLTFPFFHILFSLLSPFLYF